MGLSGSREDSQVTGGGGRGWECPGEMHRLTFMSPPSSELWAVGGKNMKQERGDEMDLALFGLAGHLKALGFILRAEGSC